MAKRKPFGFILSSFPSFSFSIYLSVSLSLSFSFSFSSLYIYTWLFLFNYLSVYKHIYIYIIYRFSFVYPFIKYMCTLYIPYNKFKLTPKWGFCIICAICMCVQCKFALSAKRKKGKRRENNRLVVKITP